MKTLFTFLFPMAALAVSGASIRNVYLPPWYDRAAFQRVELELKDLPAAFVQLDLPCTITCTNQIILVNQGHAHTTLSIDLKRTPATFPIVVLTTGTNGRLTPQQKLICHLSLVPMPFTVEVRGDTFSVTNLTEEPFVLEYARNLAITSRDDRHIVGTLHASGSIKLKGRAEIRLNPKPRS